MSGFRIMFVDIDSFQFQRLSVDKQAYIRFSVGGFLIDRFDLDATESYVERDNLIDFTLFFDSHYQLVKVRVFRCPCVYIGQILVKRKGSCLVDRDISCLLFGGNYFSLSVEQFICQCQIGCSRTMIAQVDVQSEYSVLVTVIQCRCDAEIFQGGFGL